MVQCVKHVSRLKSLSYNNCFSFQEFLTQTRTYFNLELESVDFRNRSEEARIKINSWVEEQTRGGSCTLMPGSCDKMLKLLTGFQNLRVPSHNDQYCRFDTTLCGEQLHNVAQYTAHKHKQFSSRKFLMSKGKFLKTSQYQI